jgi:DNA-binding beta-propeller fold protein YncE
MKRLFQLGLILVLLPNAGFAQWQGGAAGAGMLLTGIALFLHGSKTIEECHKNQLWNVTYLTALGLGAVNVVTQVEGPLGPCSCEGPTGNFRPSVLNGFSLVRPELVRPEQESNCTSDNGEGQQVTVPGQEAAGSTSGFGGPSSFAGGNGPLPERFGPPRLPLEVQALGKSSPLQLAARAAPPGSAFTYTLPFRDLPWGPLLGEATKPVPWACNSNINPTMFRVYHVDNVVARYNLCTGASLATIPVPAFPLQVRVTPDGSQAIVTSYSGAITFINTGTNTVSGMIQVPTDPNFAPDGIAISPDGSYALVTNYLQPPDAYLTVVNIASMEIEGKIPLDTDFPESVFINPDGTLAWVTYPWLNVAKVIDILTGTIVKTLLVTQPFSVVLNPTGTRAFVSSGAGSVQVIDTSTYNLIQSVPAGPGAMDLQMTEDGAFVFVNNSQAMSVTVIDTQSLTSTTTDIGGTPQGSVLVPSQ